MFKINRAGMVIHFVRIILLAQINAIGTETIAPKMSQRLPCESYLTLVAKLLLNNSIQVETFV